MERNKVIGNLQIKIGDKVIETVDIVNTEKINKKEAWDYFSEILSNYDVMLKNLF